MRLPEARGPISSSVIELLRGRKAGAHFSFPPSADPIAGDDFHLALYLCYELHYSAIDGVDPRLEWDPELLALRARLEEEFVTALRALVPEGDGTAGDIIDKMLAAIAADDGPSLAHYLETEATREQFEDFLIHRSAYQLKEADPHSWLIPRIRSGAKAALVEIQSDEYGGGRPERVHAALFAKSMKAVGLDSTYGAYIDRIPGISLATVNLVSMFGLHRRFLGAGVGHLAAFESTSSEPNGRYARGLRRLGFEGDALDFFDEHVEADSVHETIAIHDLVGRLIHDEPELAPDVLWGARCLLALEAIWAEHLLMSWEEGRTSLYEGELSVSR